MRPAMSFRDRSVRFLALSLVVHVGVSTVAFYSSKRHSVPVVQPETKYYPIHLIYGRKQSQVNGAAGGTKTSSASTTSSILALNSHFSPPAGSPVSTPHDPVPANGTDAESANPAFPVFSPRPPVSDRSLLPTSSQQVVVDVKVSANGEVLEATLVKGLGNGLDQIVLDTVKTWRFHPATINGNPVATEAELIFPFNQGYPTTPS